MLTLTYELDENGWVTAYIADGSNSLTFYPSLITGGDIGDLAERMLVLLKMDRQGLPAKERCSWGEEPGEYRWVLESAAGRVKIQLLFFKESWSKLLDERGRLLFSAEAPLLNFANQVKVALRDLLATLGPEEYSRRARKEFPQRTYDDLSNIIREEQLSLKAAKRRK